MYPTVRNITMFALLPILAGMPSCIPTGPPSGTYNVKTFQFLDSGPASNPEVAAPSIWIDTNTKLSSLSGGTLSSSLPCSIKFDYTDNSFSFESAVFTHLKIVYDDDTVERSTQTLKLPLRVAAKESEMANSVTGGRIVTTIVSTISGEIPSVISRAEPFNLQLDGHFIQKNGNKVAFKIKRHFEVKTEIATKSAAEVLKDK